MAAQRRDDRPRFLFESGSAGGMSWRDFHPTGLAAPDIQSRAADEGDPTRVQRPSAPYSSPSSTGTLRCSDLLLSGVLRDSLTSILRAAGRQHPGRHELLPPSPCR